MKKHTIIGTAGHIDHGKTALIKAVTGFDTDRLKEEKERGITIDIGFAYWKDNVTIIDVPGHEKFIRNMVAGVNTIDFFILVIAADDGIMPQTIEHLDILNFFNIRDGIVVINKIDLVDNEWRELIRDEVENLLEKYGMSHLDIIETSAVKNENIDILKAKTEEKISALQEQPDDRPFRLLVDRSFSIKGFGTVVTGTVLNGQLKTGDEVQIYPSLKISKVRGLQEHINNVENVQKGDRAAVNLQGITKDKINRGDVLAMPDNMIVVNEFMGSMKTVSAIPVKVANRSRIRVHTGTSERIGQLIWFDSFKILEAQQNYHVRVKLDEPVATVPGDPFLIRLHSPLLTLAGGKILEINPPKIKHKKEDWQEYYKILESGDPLIKLENIIRYQYLKPVSFKFINKKLFERADIIEKSIQKLENKRRIRKFMYKGSEHFIHTDNFNLLTDEIPSYIKKFHEKNPLKQGANTQEIIGGLNLKWMPAEIVDAALRKLLNSGILKQNQNMYALSDFEIRVAKDIDVVQQELLNILKESRFSPPDLKLLAEKLEMDVNEIRSVISMLVKDKKLYSIHNQFFIHYEIMDDLIKFLKNYFKNNSDLPVATLKDFIQTSRKYAIPLFEFLDSENYTYRVGDVRKKGKLLD